MNLINNNPFRILDVPVTASAREITRQINKLETYAAMGKTKSYDSDFSFLSPVNRTTQTIDDAKKQIEQNESKFHYSLFWFWINNSRNELAYDHLKAGNLNKAIEVWEAACDTEYLDISYYKNLSTLYLSLAVNSRSFHKDYFSKGIKLAETFFSSEDLDNYSKEIAGDNHIYDSEKTVRFYLNEIIHSINKYIDSDNGISTSQLYNILSSISIDAKQFLNSKFVLKQIQNISAEIENSISERRKNPLQSVEIGKKLIDNTKSDLYYLKDILGFDDFQYQIIADKLSLEIIQCGIDSFNSIKDEKGETDYPKAIKSEESYVSEYEYAVNIASSPATKARAKENLDTCNEAISNKHLHNCWFCNNNVPDEKSKCSTTLYKVRSRTSFPRRVNFSVIDVHVPRCKSCDAIHTKDGNISLICISSSIIVGGVIGSLIENHWFIGGIIGLIAGIIASSFFANNAKKSGIKDTEYKTKYPAYAKLISDGWSTSKPTA